MYFTKEFILILNLFLFINCVGAVSIKTICKLDNWECITKTAQDFLPEFVQGIPEIGVHTLDPLQIKKIDLSIGTLTLILTDITVTGLKDTIIRKISIDESTNVLTLKAFIRPNVHAKYEMSGNLLLLPIQGQGPLHAKLGLEMIIDAYLTKKQLEDGKLRWKCVYKSNSFKQKDKSEIVFENLFPGNRILATAANEMIAQNANEIVEEVGPKLVKHIIEDALENIQTLYDNIELKDLYIM